MKLSEQCLKPPLWRQLSKCAAWTWRPGPPGCHVGDALGLWERRDVDMSHQGHLGLVDPAREREREREVHDIFSDLEFSHNNQPIVLKSVIFSVRNCMTAMKILGQIAHSNQCTKCIAGISTLSIYVVNVRSSYTYTVKPLVKNIQYTKAHFIQFYCNSNSNVCDVECSQWIHFLFSYPGRKKRNIGFVELINIIFFNKATHSTEMMT